MPIPFSQYLEIVPLSSLPLMSRVPHQPLELILSCDLIPYCWFWI